MVNLLKEMSEEETEQALDNLLKAMIAFEISENCTPMAGKIKQQTAAIPRQIFRGRNEIAMKLLCVKKHLGKQARKRLILSHHKNLNIGDYLIEDRTKNGADKFPGEHIHFATPQFPDWPSVVKYLFEKL